MKFVIILVLATAAAAAKLPFLDSNLIPILRDARDEPVGAIYKYSVETGNGIKLEEIGSTGSAGQSNAQGSFSFETPEGELVVISYTADENGFHVADSPFIPTPHPLPAHAIEQIRFAGQERARNPQ